MSNILYSYNFTMLLCCSFSHQKLHKLQFNKCLSTKNIRQWVRIKLMAETCLLFKINQVSVEAIIGISRTLITIITYPQKKIHSRADEKMEKITDIIVSETRFLSKLFNM